jgi:predicted enzyme related to lactoylglutathione lyase
MGSPTMWFEVAGKDREALKRFYGELFEWRFDDMEEMPYSVVAPTDGGIAGGMGAASEGQPGHVTFYVKVDDIDSALARAESLGARRIMGPVELPGGTKIALFADPEGHPVGLMTAITDPSLTPRAT